MPRITPLRILLLLPLLYLGLVLLWLGLPSPEVSWSDDPSGRLWRGGRVTRVYDVDDFFHWTDNIPSVQQARSSDRRSFAVEYSYDRGTDALLVGDSQGDSHAHSFNLTALLPASFDVSVSEVLTVRCKTGDEDGINLPWFTQADATLLFWDIHRDTAELPLRLRVQQRDDAKLTVELLAQSSFLESNEDTRNLMPLLTITLDAALSGQNGQGRDAFHAYFPRGSRNSSPSRTFIFRRAISAILVPSWFFVEAVMNAVGAPIFFIVQDFLFLFTLLGFYVVLVLACWRKVGSPAFWPWARRFWLTRGVAAYLEPRVTAKASKVRKDSGDGGSEDQSQDDRVEQGPQPLTSVWAFFRSSSPLDDLFVTFEVTRGLVRPLELSRRRTRLGDEEARIEHGSAAETGGQDGVGKLPTTTGTDTVPNGEKN